MSRRKYVQLKDRRQARATKPPKITYELTRYFSERGALFVEAVVWIGRKRRSVFIGVVEES